MYVPPGNAVSDDDKITVKDVQAFCTADKPKYRQGKHLTCLVDSFASALHVFGCVEEARKLNRQGRVNLNQSNLKCIGDTMDYIYYKLFETRFQMVKISATEGMSLEALLQVDDSWPIAALLRSEDGGEGQHAVGMLNGCIFESNSPRVLRKCAEAFHFSTGKRSICTGAFSVYRLAPNKQHHWTTRLPPVRTFDNHRMVWMVTSKPKKEPVMVQYFDGATDRWTRETANYIFRLE